jgi:hypothetical protein
MLYLETDKDGNEVFLHADREGIQKLRNVLDFLLHQPDQPEHDHLFTPAWAGSELDETLTGEGKLQDSGENRVVHHLKMHYWPNS